MTRYRTDNPFTSEEEAEADARAAEQEVEDWLASWSDDFNSDGWLEAATA